eukprot:c2604_g1_i2 orf=563-1297(-)
MESLSTFNACLQPPIQYGSGSSRRLLSPICLHFKSCNNLTERANNLRAGSIRQSRLSRFEDGTRRRSTSQHRVFQVIKAGETEAPVQNETLLQEVQKESEQVANQTEENAAEKPSAIAEAKKDEGGATENIWVLRSANEGEGKSQAIIFGDGILVGAAPDATGSSKPFVVDYPMVSSAHARVYGKDRRSYQNTIREYFVMDLGSTNGTFLNRSKLRPQAEVKLSPGDTLKFGDERATFVVESQN